jgi:hypothetical protein
LLLISKSGTDVTGTHETYRPRSKLDFEKGGFEIWGLYSDEKNRIHLDQNGADEHVTINESGFVV